MSTVYTTYHNISIFVLAMLREFLLADCFVWNIHFLSGHSLAPGLSFDSPAGENILRDMVSWLSIILGMHFMLHHPPYAWNWSRADRRSFVGFCCSQLNAAIYDYCTITVYCTYRKISNIKRTLMGNKIVDHHWSLRCSWSIACRRCSNYIFILDLASGFKGFGKDSRKTVRESFKCWDLVRLILETWRYTVVCFLSGRTTRVIL